MNTTQNIKDKKQIDDGDSVIKLDNFSATWDDTDTSKVGVQLLQN